MNQDDAKYSIAQAVEALKMGQAIGFPTETVYGLAADALNPKAVANIFQIKERPSFDPLIVHIHNRDEADRYATSFPLSARKLTERYWPGPLTIILPKASIIPDIVTSGLPYVALRMPAHPIALEVIRQFNGPLAAPSANRFGRISPTTAAAVRAELGDRVELILNGGPCAIGVESTIVHFGLEQPFLLRQGGIPQEEIESLIGPLAAPPVAKENQPLAPGMLLQHYAPRTPLKIIQPEELAQIAPAQRRTSGLLTWGPGEEQGFAIVRNLSPQGNRTEAAARLFQSMRELDAAGVESILCLLLPEIDLGRAINDRLRRAAHS